LGRRGLGGFGVPLAEFEGAGAFEAGLEGEVGWGGGVGHGGRIKRLRRMGWWARGFKESTGDLVLEEVAGANSLASWLFTLCLRESCRISKRNFCERLQLKAMSR